MYYITSKELKEEVRVVIEMIREASSDLGGDLNYLNDRFSQLEERIQALEEQFMHISRGPTNE